jgi:hypothetical protein
MLNSWIDHHVPISFHGHVGLDHIICRSIETDIRIIRSVLVFMSTTQYTPTFHSNLGVFPDILYLKLEGIQRQILVDDSVTHAILFEENLFNLQHHQVLAD